MVIAQSDEQKQPGQERDDDNADRRSGQQFEVKMLRAKEPRRTSADETSTNLGFRRYVDLSH
jgi:hypothetical protein